MLSVHRLREVSRRLEPLSHHSQQLEGHAAKNHGQYAKKTRLVTIINFNELASDAFQLYC